MLRRCKYTNVEKYLVEVEDKVDDESFESLRLQEEVQAAAGELPDDFQGFSLHLAQSMGLDDAPASKADESKVKLESFPAIELSRLAERVKKFKDHALQRKSKYNTTAERLRLEGSKGHENLCLHYHAVVMSMAPASQSYTTSICFRNDLEELKKSLGASMHLGSSWCLPAATCVCARCLYRCVVQLKVSRRRLCYRLCFFVGALAFPTSTL